MSEELYDRIAALEESRRRWKVLAVIGWVGVAVLVVGCLGLGAFSYVQLQRFKDVYIEQIQKRLPD
jgi:hypothetical protein